MTASSHDNPLPPDENEELFGQLVCKYIDQIIDGEPVDDAAILRNHPELAPRVLRELRTFTHFDGSDNTAITEEPLGTLGDYTLRREIGRGGMGVVYDAWQNSVDRQVALKVLPAGIAVDTRSVTRFIREAKTAAQLNHPNVVRVHGMGVEENTPYFAMEFVAGETLAQTLHKLRQTETDEETDFGKKDRAGYFEAMAEAFANVADGLQHAHSKGVIHRDVKPSNLIFDRERKLRILDFGLARLEGHESLTISGDVVGTPSYMSPEQARAKKVPIDNRTDVYSLGATLYETLTLQPPFKGKDHQQTLSQIIERDPRPPRQLNPRVPPDLETITLHCLCKEPTDRYGTAEALAQDLRRFARGDLIEAQAQSLWEKTARRLWRRRRLALGVGAVLTVTLIGSLVANVLIARARDAAEVAREEAEDAREQLRYELYVSGMRGAHQDWRSGNVRRYLESLERHVPQADEPDLRGWEWYYLRGLFGKELLSKEVDQGTVASVAWSPDGRHLAAGGGDGIVKIWELGEASDELKEVQRLPHDIEVTQVAWSPKGEWLAAALKRDVAVVWKVFPHEKEKTFLLSKKKGKLKPRGVAWSPDESQLAVGYFGEDRGVQIFNVETGDRERTLDSSQEVRSVGWSPDSRYFAASGPTVWETKNWTVVQDDDQDLAAKSTAWTSDGACFAAGGRGRLVRVWQVGTWEEEALWDRPASYGSLWAVAWSADDERLATGGADNTVRIWDRATGDELLSLAGHSDFVRSVAWHPKRELLASASQDGTVKLWATDATLEEPVFQGRNHVAWSADGEWLATIDPEKAGDVTVLDANGEIRGRVVVTQVDRVMLLALSSDSETLATATHDGTVQLWNWREPGDDLLSFRPHGEVNSNPAWGPTMSLAWSPKGDRFATGGHDRKAFVWNRSGNEVLSVSFESKVHAVAWSPDGDFLAGMASGGNPGTIEIWDVTSRQRVRKFAGRGRNEVWGRALAWNPTGDRLAASCRGGGFSVFDTTSAEVFLGHGHIGGSVKSIVWSPDGRRLATAGGDQTLRIWDADRGGDELLTLRGLRRVAWSLAWHPDGERLAAASMSELKIWEAPGYADGGREGDE